MPLHCLAVFKTDPEAVNELPLIRQRLGRVHDALRLAAHGGDEALLGRDVRVKIDILQAVFAAALELCLRDHAHAQVRAVGRGIVQLADTEAVEVIAACEQVLIVLLPRGDGIVIHAAGLQNSLPQLFDRLPDAQLREELFCPRRAGHSGDAPLVFIFDLVAVALDEGIEFLTRLCHLLLIDAREPIGISREQVDAAGDGLDVVLPAHILVIVQRRERGEAAIADVGLLQRLIAPIHHDLLRLELVALFDDHFNKFGLVEVRLDKDLLPLLHIHAAARDELRIFAKYGFFHDCVPPVCSHCAYHTTLCRI